MHPVDVLAAGVLDEAGHALEQRGQAQSEDDAQDDADVRELRVGGHATASRQAGRPMPAA
ncbi:hypothetical protein D3C87_2201120 [compost metagenome]